MRLLVLIILFCMCPVCAIAGDFSTDFDIRVEEANRLLDANSRRLEANRKYLAVIDKRVEEARGAGEDMNDVLALQVDTVKRIVYYINREESISKAFGVFNEDQPPNIGSPYQTFRLRLTKKDMATLKQLASKNKKGVSAIISDALLNTYPDAFSDEAEDQKNGRPKGK